MSHIGQSSQSNSWNPKNGSQMGVKGHQKACVGYGTCGLSVNMPAACLYSSMEMYARTSMQALAHILYAHSDFIGLRDKQSQYSFTG